MAHFIPAQTQVRSLTRDFLDAAQPYLPGRRGVFILGGLAAIVVLSLSWSWLAALGVASVLLTVLPCLAMCALGLCMNRMGGRSCSTGTDVPTALSSTQGQPAQDKEN